MSLVTYYFKLLSTAVRTRVLAAREPLSNGPTNARLDDSEAWNWGFTEKKSSRTGESRSGLN